MDHGESMPESSASHDIARGEGHHPWRPRGWTSGRALPMAVGVAGGILLAQASASVFSELRGLFTLVIVSLFLSFGLEPAVQYLARRGMRRGPATGIVLLGALALVIGFVAAMTSLVAGQVSALVAAGPGLVDALAAQAASVLPGEAGTDLAAWLAEQRRLLPTRLADNGFALGRDAVGIGQTLIGVLFQVATVALLTFYLAADGPKLRAALARRLPPTQQVRVLGLWELAISKTGGYIYSRALTAVVSSAFHVAVFTAIDLDYAIALAVWVGVISSLIPVVGTYLAGALPVVVALASDSRQALWTLVAIVAYQQVENYVVVPRITATTLELHPAVAFLSVLGGAALAGAPGALLAIPAVAVATALFSASGEEYEVLAHHLVDTGRPGAAELVGRAERGRSRPTPRRRSGGREGPATSAGPRAPEDARDTEDLEGPGRE